MHFGTETVQSAMRLLIHSPWRSLYAQHDAFLLFIPSRGIF